MRRDLETVPIYHCIIRGNDDRFVSHHGQDIVTNYFLTGIDELIEIIAEMGAQLWSSEVLNWF